MIQKLPLFTDDTKLYKDLQLTVKVLNIIF